MCRQMKGEKSGDGLLAGKRSEQTRRVNVVNDSSSRGVFSGRATKITALLRIRTSVLRRQSGAVDPYRPVAILRSARSTVVVSRVP
jgi:hypothetical protein